MPSLRAAALRHRLRYAAAAAACRHDYAMLTPLSLFFAAAFDVADFAATCYDITPPLTLRDYAAIWYDMPLLLLILFTLLLSYAKPPPPSAPRHAARAALMPSACAADDYYIKRRTYAGERYATHAKTARECCHAISALLLLRQLPLHLQILIRCSGAALRTATRYGQLMLIAYAAMESATVADAGRVLEHTMPCHSARRLYGAVRC